MRSPNFNTDIWGYYGTFQHFKFVKRMTQVRLVMSVREVNLVKLVDLVKQVNLVELV